MKKGALFISIFIVLIGFITFYCNYKVEEFSENKLYDNVDTVPHKKTALLLGTTKYLSGGQINPYFKYRIDATVELFKKGKIDFIIASGDNGRESYNEPEDMRNALIEEGVPEDRIKLDHAGFRTLDSVLRANAIFSQDDFIIISQKFHNERAVFIAFKNNLKAIAFNAKDVSRNFGYKTIVREYFARVKVFMDILFQKEPKFYGEKVLIES